MSTPPTPETPPTPKTPPTPDKSEGLSNAAKVLAGAVAIVTAAAGTLGTANGGLAFLFRNKPGLFIAALVLAALAAGAATWAILWIPKDRRTREISYRIAFIAVSALCLVLALGFVVYIQTTLAHNRSRPIIKAELATASTGYTLKIKVEADALTVDDQLLINVAVSESKATATPGPVESSQKIYYFGTTGPDRNGHASQGATLPIRLNTSRLGAVVVSASVITKEKLSGLNISQTLLACDGSLRDYSTNPAKLLPGPGAASCVNITSFPKD
jgi:hypothetical protein